MDIVELVRTRYTTKHYDPARRISDRDIADLMEVLRLSPSSVNSQPWHFFVTGTDEGKARVMPAVLDFNRPRQAYIAMGFLLWAAAERGIDSTCLEGLDMAKMDECLGLAEKGLRTVCAVSLGYRLPEDSNAARPKSRLPMDEVVTVF